MQLYTLNTTNNQYIFINEYIKTSSGFNHKSTLTCNNNEIASNTAHYLNRTWESYPYQSSMNGCIYKLLNDRKNKLIDEYKSECNIKRLSAKKYEKFIKPVIEDDPKIKEYQAILNELQ